MPTIETLQGELLALRGFVASMLEVMPLATRVQFAGRLDRNLFLLRPCQAGELMEGFDRAVVSLAAKRLTRTDTDPGAAHGEERRSQPQSAGRARPEPFR